MKEKLTNNLGIKLLSLLLAAMMWIVIINLDDPTTTRTYQNITVDITNESAIASLGQVYDIVDGRTVTITVKGKRSVIDKIKSADLKASVDLSNISAFNKVEITATCEKYSYENLEISTKPKLMEITLEDRDETQVNVKVVTTGTPADGYSVGLTEAKPVLLEISGAKSVVAKIAEARVTVDVSGEAETFTRKGLIPTLYDADGNEIDASRLTFNKQKVAATVNILKTKTVPIEVTTKGTPADVYDISYNPIAVELAGTDEDLAKVISIPIEIDVSHASSNVEQTVDLVDYLPKGIRLVENVDSVAIRITVQAMETREFYLNTSEILTKNKPEGLNLSFTEPETTIRVEIRGMADALSGLTATSLGAYLDLEGLSEGTHQVKLNFMLEDGLQLVGTPTVSIRLGTESEEPNEEEPNDTEEEPEAEPEEETE
jgi:YbbR domain-containing protein